MNEDKDPEEDERTLDEKIEDMRKQELKNEIKGYFKLIKFETFDFSLN